MAAACVEHAAELRWAPWLKLPAVSWAGLAAVVAGELLRKAAMVSPPAAWGTGAEQTMKELPPQLQACTATGAAQALSPPSLPRRHCLPTTAAAPGTGPGAAQLHAPDPNPQAAGAHARNGRRVRLGAAPGVRWMDGVGGGHAAAVVQPAVHGGICGGGVALL